MTKRRRQQHPPKFVELILWADHHEPTQETWGTPTKRRDLRAAQILSAGFVSEENGKIAELVRDLSDDQLIGARLHLIKRTFIARVKVPIPDAIMQVIKSWKVQRSAGGVIRGGQLLMKRAHRLTPRKRLKKR